MVPGVARVPSLRPDGSRAREFYIQLTGRENKDFANSRSRTHSSTCSRAPIWRGRDRQRWVILLGDIVSYPEMCAERVVLRSASAPALSASAFVSIFFSKYARASSTGRDAAEVHSV